MGNSLYTLGLKIEQETYQVGSTVSGVVYLAVSYKVLLPLAPMSIDFHFRGEELTRRGSVDGMTETETHQLCALQDCIARFFSDPPFSLKPGGQYEFPFSFTLPTRLPDTFNIRDSCLVHYYVEARLNSHARKSPAVLAKARIPLQILGGSFDRDRELESLESLVSYLAGKNSFPIPRGMFLRPGSMSMYVKIGDGRKFPMQAGQSYPIYLAANNDSTKSVQFVAILLREKANFHGRPKTIVRPLHRQVVKTDDFPELVKVRLKPPDARRVDLGEAYRSNTLPWKLLANFTIPSDTLVFHGHLVSISHVLRVSLITNGDAKCDPYVEIPCVITRSPRDQSQEQLPVAVASSVRVNDVDATGYESQARALPAEWSPQIAEPVEIPFAEATLLPS